MQVSLSLVVTVAASVTAPGSGPAVRARVDAVVESGSTVTSAPTGSAHWTESIPPPDSSETVNEAGASTATKFVPAMEAERGSRGLFLGDQSRDCAHCRQRAIAAVCADGFLYGS